MPMPIVAQNLTAAEKLAAVGDQPDAPGPLATDLSPALTHAAIAKAMRRVGDWELRRSRTSFNQDWTFATLYAGMMAASDALHEAKYRKALLDAGRTFQWNLGTRQSHADDQAVAQTYLDLYLYSHDPAMMAPTKTAFDTLMEAPDDPEKPLWWWSDALFMAPPVWARLYRATGNSAYFNYMNREWWITSSHLYDEREHLYFRDAGYLDKKEANGKGTYWSRGNGWVMAGLVRVLAYMPAGYPDRGKYIAQYREMAAKLVSIQSEDGLWRPGLMDAAAYKLPETSGSAFFVYALAWGVNNGVLDRAIYLPAVRKGWSGLLAHTYADGRFGCVQPVGEKPGNYKPSASSVFGVGAFLLAGSEVYRLSDRPKHTEVPH